MDDSRAMRMILSKTLEESALTCPGVNGREALDWSGGDRSGAGGLEHAEVSGLDFRASGAADSRVRLLMVTPKPRSTDARVGGGRTSTS